jgi:hypothetical protein
MSAKDKWAKNGVAFALAIVKPGTVFDLAEFSRIETALQVMFPEVSIILLVEDDEFTSYQRRQEFSDFMQNTPRKVILSSRITLN